MAPETPTDKFTESTSVSKGVEPGPSGAQAWPELLSTMDRQIADCSWCNEQTHESLVKFLLEETHELAEAIETGDRRGMREELGDVLLQIVFHSRIASEAQENPFTADDVVRDLTAKMVRRHPHVFAGREIDGDLFTQWDAIKRTETQRTSILDGIPASLGALAHTQKVLGRAARAGIEAPLNNAPHNDEEELGAELFALVQRASAAGIDAEGALRATTRSLVQHVQQRENTEERENADDAVAPDL